MTFRITRVHKAGRLICALLLCLCLVSSLAAAEGPWSTELDDRIAEDGMWITWPADQINDFHEQLGYSGPVSDNARPGLISRDEAIAIARSFILEHVETTQPQYCWLNGIPAANVDEAFMDSLKAAAFLTASDETDDLPDCWHVNFYADEWLTVALDTFDVRIDAHTGEVIMFFEPGGNG